MSPYRITPTSPIGEAETHGGEDSRRNPCVGAGRETVKNESEFAFGWAQPGHGEWIPWCEESLPFKSRQAYKYLRIYHDRDSLSVHSNAHLTIDEACKALVKNPRPHEVEADWAPTRRPSRRTGRRNQTTQGSPEQGRALALGVFFFLDAHPCSASRGRIPNGGGSPPPVVPRAKALPSPTRNVFKGVP